MRRELVKIDLTAVCTSYRLATMDTVILTVPQIVEQFQVSAGTVRAWIAADLIKPVRREGRGRAGTMYFARGEIAPLVSGLCSICGNGFKKAKIGQRFCSKACRQKSSRMRLSE